MYCKSSSNAAYGAFFPFSLNSPMSHNKNNKNRINVTENYFANITGKS